MSPEVDLTDPENPEWTEADFARAKGPESLPAHIPAAFPKTRGAQKTPTKAAVSIRLDADVLNHFRGGGPGWQSRINETLRRAMKAG